MYTWKPPQNTYIVLYGFSHYSGRAESTKYTLKPSFAVRSELVDFQVYTIFTKMGSRSTQNIYNYVGFSHGFLEKWKTGGPECFVLLSFSWYSGAPCRHFGPKWAPGPKTLNPDRTPGCGFRCFSWKIASRNHQYSLGFNWYFACGDDGKLDSKST